MSKNLGQSQVHVQAEVKVREQVKVATGLAPELEHGPRLIS